MFMAGGYLDNDVQRTFSAVTRAISAARTLVAWECGAAGPDKDCGYEGPIVKSIAGKPTAQEGKNCQCAHCDLQGNLMAQVCDLWSNESVEYHPEFGGSSVQCWLGPLGYEVSLMNTAIQTGQEKTLRDLYMISDTPTRSDRPSLRTVTTSTSGPRLPDSPLPRSSRADTRARRSS